MKLILPLALLLLCAADVAAQSFTVVITPKERTIESEGQTEYVVMIEPNGFTATVNLQAALVAGHAPGIDVTLDRVYINPPYTQSATLTVRTQRVSLGTSQIAVRGSNGAIEAADTCTLHVEPQAIQRGWSVYNTGNSVIPTDHIFSMELDREGNGWIASANTLARFDRNRWLVIPLGANTYNDQYRALIVDDNGDPWLGTSGGVIRVDVASSEVILYSDKNNGFPVASNILDIARAPDGTIWAVTIDRVFVKYQGGVWTVDQAATDSPFRAIVDMQVNSKGEIWVIGAAVNHGHFDLLGRFDGTFWSVYPAADLGLPEYTRLSSLSLDPQENLWVTSGYGVVRMKGTEPTAFPLTHLPFPGPAVESMAFDMAGSSWNTSTNGLVHYDGQNAQLFNTANSGLPMNYVHVVRVDRNGVVWAGTAGQGLAIYDPRVAGIDRPVPPSEDGSATIIPNPVTGASRIDFTLTAHEHVRVSIANSLGKEVAVLLDEPLEAGAQRTRLDAASLPAGAYFLRIVTASDVETRPFVVAR